VVRLNVNGADVEVDDRFAASPLLRDVLGLHGTKYGCAIGYCAACTVLIDPTGNDAYHGRTGPLPIGSEHCSAATAATCQTLRPCYWRTLIAAGSRRED
jgi:hypothetical protein